MTNRVLLVNDSKFESIVFNDLLSQLGYNVKITDEYDAVDEVQSFSPDIVLVNYIMRETRGDELAEAIKDRVPGVKCLLTSSNMITMDTVGNEKIDGIIKTPVDRQKLEFFIRSVENTAARAAEKGAERETAVERASVEDVRNRWKKWKRKSVEAVEVSLEADEPEAALEYAFCPGCGRELGREEKFVFCPFCGRKL